MKIKTVLLLALLTAFISSFSQNWTKTQLEKANTAKDIPYLTKTEKEAIMYINLCRLFPKDFAKIEVGNYQMDSAYADSILIEFEDYKKSLQNDLQKRKACKPLKFDKTLYVDAKCYSNEISKNNREGHERKNCNNSNYAECISFGQKTGKEIALQLLVDSGIKSLGHRNICLDKTFSKIGLSANKHFEFKFCAVIEII